MRPTLPEPLGSGGPKYLQYDTTDAPRTPCHRLSMPPRRVPAPGRAPVPPCCSSSTPPLPHALPGARPPAKGPEWQYWLTLGPVKGHQATGPPGHRATRPQGHRATGPQGHKPPDCSKPSVAAGAQNSNPKIELRVMSLLACNDVFQALGPQSRPCLVCGAPHSIRSNLLRCRGATCGMDNQDDI